MNRTDTFLALACVAVFFAILAGVSGKAHSQDHDAGHALYHDFYQRWRMPHAPQAPCCNAKKTENGVTTGDCYPTPAELRPAASERGGLAWWAQRDTGEWIEIPESRIIREKNPDPTGRDAHLCEIGGLVFCFKPPVGSL